jgi:hypothetical protein
MPLGTDIGDAYIDVHARTGPFRRELRREARRAAAEAGSEAGEEFSDGFDAELSPLGRRLARRMRANGELSGEQFNDGLRRAIQDRFGRVVSAFNRSVADLDFSGFVGQFDDLGDAVASFERRLRSLAANGQVTRVEFDEIRDSFDAYASSVRRAAQQDELDRSLREQIQALNEQDEAARRVAQTFERNLGPQLRRSANNAAQFFRRAAEGVSESSRVMRRESEAARRAFSELAEEFGERLPGVIEELRRTDIGFDRLTRNVARNSDRIRRNLRRALRIDEGDTSAIRAIDQAIERMADTAQTTVVSVDRLNRGLGRLKGGRNDFLNLIGSMDQFVRSGVLRALDRTFGAVGDSVRRLGERITDVRGPLSTLGNLFLNAGNRIQAMGTSLDGFLVQLVLGSIAFRVFVGILGPAIALLSALSGAFVALTVSVGGALAGGLVALGPILLGLGAGVGAVAIAFSDLSKQQERVFKPFGDWVDEVRELVQGELFKGLAGDIRSVVDVLSADINPILRDVAANIRFAFGQFAEVIQGDAFQESLSTFQVFLPSIMNNLLSIIGNLGLALFNMFAAASPATQDFLERINGVVERFAEWTGQEDGRQAIRDFMERAVDLLDSIWDLITSVSETFGNFFEDGNRLGQRMIDNLTQILDNFNAWLNTEAGRDELRGWFEDAETIIGEVGDVLRQAGDLIDELDSPQNRATLLVILTAFEQIIGVVTDLVRFVNRTTAAITGIRDGGVSLQRIDGLLDRLSGAFTNVRRAAARVADAIVDVFNINLFGRGQGIIDGLIRGIESGAGRLLGLAQFLAQQISNTFAGVLGLFSPSRVFRDYGRDITEGLILGMQAGQAAVQATAAGLINTDALSSLNTPLGQLGQDDGTAAAGSSSTTNLGGITIVTPFADPRLVAMETMDALAARGR